MTKRDSRITEAAAQARLLQWTLDGLNHALAVPNPKTIYRWECDLLSVTRARLTHEFEIKRTDADYLAEFANKPHKHQTISNKNISYHANYFWFVTCDLEIEPPGYAGWISLMDTGKRIDLRIKKTAPRLHREKLTDKQMETLGRLACYRLKNLMVKQHNNFN